MAVRIREDGAVPTPTDSVEGACECDLLVTSVIHVPWPCPKFDYDILFLKFLVIKFVFKLLVIYGILNLFK